MARSKSFSTMQDVAKLAGVSTATVSRAFSHPEKLAPTTRHRVEEAVLSCGYSTASIPATVQTRLILAIVAYQYEFIDNDLIQSMKCAAAEKGYTLIIDYTPRPGSKTNYIQYNAMLRLICGIIQIGADTDLTHILASLPRVIIGCTDYHSDAVIVDIDHISTAFHAVNTLYQQGGGRIAYISGSPHNHTTSYHEQGYRQALRRQKIAVEQDYIIYGEATFEHGQEAITRLMALPQPPSAIYCTHDTIAIGVIYQLKRLERQIPQTVSLLAFSSSEVGQHLDPPLVSVRYPTTQIGHKAVNVLVEWLRFPHIKPKSYVFDPPIVQICTTIKR